MPTGISAPPALIAGGMANSYLAYVSHSIRVMYPVLGAIGLPGRSTSRCSSRAGSSSFSASCSGTAGMSPGTGIPPFPAFPR
ncbi:MAG: hypothetical protein ACLR0N_10570 [Bilophila wadsworthia]